MNRDEAQKTRLRYRWGSALSVAALIGALAGVNLFAGHHEHEWDLTRERVHEFSEQTVKLVSSLDAPVKGELYASSAVKEALRPLFEKYERLSSQFTVEVVDPQQEQARTREAGIRKLGTLVLNYQGRVVKVEEVSEQNVTQAILKLQREKKPVICSLIGHGEASIEDATQNGLHVLKTALEDQAYDVRELSLSGSSRLSDCATLLSFDAHGTFYPQELKSIRDYLDQGGRAIFSAGAALQAKDETSPELKSLLADWGLDLKPGLVVDPFNRKQGVDDSLLLASFYNPAHPITATSLQPSYFPFARPIETRTVGDRMAVALVKTSDESWVESDVKSFTRGRASFDAAQDRKGPLSIAAASRGKTGRIVVFGASGLFTNQYARAGSNLDFLLNAINWAQEREDQIAIRVKEASAGQVELPQKEGAAVFWMLVVVMPFAFALFGAMVWRRRRHL